MDYYPACSLQSDLLARFLGGSSRWTTTCKAAREFAVTNGLCSCQYRFQCLLNLAQREYRTAFEECGWLLRTCCLSQDLPCPPVCLFWYTRIKCSIEWLDQQSGLSDKCQFLSFRHDSFNKLECRNCTSQSASVWEREAILYSEKRCYYCSKCLLEAHQQIKHTVATAQHYDVLFQRIMTTYTDIRISERWVFTVEAFHLELYGVCLQTKVPHMYCEYCEQYWFGWYCWWCRTWMYHDTVFHRHDRFCGVNMRRFWAIQVNRSS